LCVVSLRGLPLLCIYKDPAAFPVPANLTFPGNPKAQWAYGVVATTPPVAGATFAHLADAEKFCVSTFGAAWRVAEFHENPAGWNFQSRPLAGDGQRPHCD